MTEKEEHNALGDKKESSFILDNDFEQIVQELVPRTDDPTAPSFTFRVVILGGLFCCLLSFINTLFTFRGNPFSITSYIAIMLAFPMGQFLAKVLPKTSFLGVELNPGPFSVKEHVLIGVWASTGASGIYGVENLVVQDLFYGFDIGWFWGLLFLIASSVLGFGIAGICRKFLIRPAHMVWPSVLPQVAMYTAFHSVKTEAVQEDGKKHLSGIAMFLVGFLIMFTWQWFPTFIAQMTQTLPLMCLLTPNSATWAQQMGSPKQGVGMFSISLDWTIGNGGTNMALPYWSSVNAFASSVIFMWILTPMAWSGNWFGIPEKVHYKLNTSALYSGKTGKKVTARSIVDPKTHKIDETKYENLKPLYMSPLFAFSYWGSMATFSAAVGQCVFWYGKDIVQRLRGLSHADETDIHCQIMDKNYAEVPDTWYYGFFLLTLVLTTVVFLVTEMKMPFYYTLLATFLSVFSVVPIAVILATSGVALYMNVISEFIIGLISPGDPVQMMAFKSLSVSVSLQCLTLLSDLKLGHYLKINPRHMYATQIISQFLAAAVALLTMRLWFSSKDHREWVQEQTDVAPGAAWSGYSPNVFFNASLIWGAVGPKRFFFDSVYSPIIISGLIIGFITPGLLKGCQLLFGESIIPWRLINPAVLYQAGSPVGNQSGIFSNFVVATIFQFFVYRYATGWWKRYNYVLSAAFDAGAAVTAVVATLLLTDNGIKFPDWLLNTSAEAPDKTVYGSVGDFCNWGSANF